MKPMESKEILNGSKLIAEYMGFVYIPFSVDLKERGFSSAGWYKTVDAKPTMEECTQTSFNSESDEIEVKKIVIDVNKLKYNQKSGYKLIGNTYYKFICRNHGELRFWNSLDALVPVIQKIEKEDKQTFLLNNNGCTLLDEWVRGNKIESYDLPNWSNNVFKVIVGYLKTR